jgi:hypothetical protein
VVDPEDAVVKVLDYIRATSLYWPDHAAQHSRPVGSRRPAERAGQGQCRAPARDRRPDQRLGMKVTTVARTRRMPSARSAPG